MFMTDSDRGPTARLPSTAHSAWSWALARTMPPRTHKARIMADVGRSGSSTNAHEALLLELGAWALSQ